MRKQMLSSENFCLKQRLMKNTFDTGKKSNSTIN